AADEFRAALASINKAPGRARFVSNRTGAVTDDAAIAEQLVAQLTQPFQWHRAMATLDALRVRKYMVCGPGRTMRAPVRRNVAGVEIMLTDTAHPKARSGLVEMDADDA